MATDLNTLPLSSLYETLASSGLARRLFELARDEDLGIEGRPGDITSISSIPADFIAVAEFNARSGGVISGLAAIPHILDIFAPSVRFEAFVHDGDRVSPDTVLGFLQGPARQILAAERVMINTVARLSGVASLTAQYVAAAVGAGKDVGSRIYDTRKTTPGLRILEKYAVRCGGGHCHRIGLYDAVLIKDNHIARIGLHELGAYASKAAAVARAINPDLKFVMVEVDSLAQLTELTKIPAGTINIVLLDNMTPQRLQEAVAIRNASPNPGIELEASGGVNLQTIAAIAATGVDRISIGALTHHAVSIDIGLDFKNSMN